MMETKPRKIYKFASDEDNAFAKNFVKTVVVLGGLGCLIFFVMGLARNPVNSTGEVKKAQFWGKPKAAVGVPNSLHEQAKAAQAGGDLLKAKALYQQLIKENPQYEKMADAQQEFGDLNMQIILSNLVTPQTIEYQVKSGDSLVKIAKKNGTTVDLLKISNGLKNNILHIGQKLRVWNAPFTITVNKAQNTLTVKTGEEAIKVYSVATGANNITPVGEFTITTKMENPVWFHKGKVVPPESQENALGTRWLGLNLPQYGIHGTIEPQLIGKQVSHGCVRMRNEDVEQLFNIIPLGTKVTILD